MHRPDFYDELNRTDRRWYETFVDQLRATDAAPDAIEEAVASVRDRTVRTENSPGDLLGDPAAYADSLTLPSRSVDNRQTWAMALAALLVAGGVFIGKRALDAGLPAEAVPVNVGALVSLLLLGTATATVLLMPATMTRLLARLHGVMSLVAVAVFTAVVVALPLVAQTKLGALMAAVALAGAVVMVLVAIPAVRFAEKDPTQRR